MRSTFKVLFFLKRDKKKANGNMPVFCRITVDGKEARFGIKADVNPEYWDVSAGKAIGRTTEIVEINSLIDCTKAALFNTYHELKELESQVTAEKVKNTFLGIETRHQTLLELFMRHNQDVEKLVGINKSKATYQKYEVTRRHLADFIKKRYNVSDISLKDINNMFINDFEVFLMTTCACGHNTTAKFMQFLKRIIIIARNNGWMYIPFHTDPLFRWILTPHNLVCNQM